SYLTGGTDPSPDADRQIKCQLLHISRHDGASARCSVSNRPDPPSVSCPFTPPSTTHSTSSAPPPPAARFASSETKRSGRGEPPPRPEHELGLPNCAGPNSVRVTAPSGLLETAEPPRTVSLPH